MLVSRRSEVSVRRLAILLIAIIVHLTAWSSEQASAQGLFELLFGNGGRAPAPPPQAMSYASPAAPVVPVPSTQPTVSAARSVDYCVRLCDGQFFPIQHHRAASSVQICNSFCPASKTKVFTGTSIGQAIAADGTRYASPQHAFVFQKTLVPACSCNGKNHFGLAPVDASADPTLQPGDIVATASGLVTITETKSNRTASRANYSLSN